VAERFADGQATAPTLRKWQAAAFEAFELTGEAGHLDAADAAYCVAHEDAATAALNVSESVAEVEEVGQCDLLRDIVGNPFRVPPPIDRAWLCWNDGTIPRLALASYEERSLPAGVLDTVRLSVLADALEDAGCADADLLGHLRGSGPHVRGCFALDAVLGKS
jgi:hypothetical protein